MRSYRNLLKFITIELKLSNGSHFKQFFVHTCVIADFNSACTVTNSSRMTNIMNNVIYYPDLQKKKKKRSDNLIVTTLSRTDTLYNKYVLSLNQILSKLSF